MGQLIDKIIALLALGDTHHPKERQQIYSSYALITCRWRLIVAGSRRYGEQLDEERARL
jgi:hypothetical protein